MRIEVEVHGSTHDVTVDPVPGHPGRYRVSWDGTSHEVDARVVTRDRHGLVLSFVRTGGGAAASRQVRCAPTDRPAVTALEVGGAVMEAVINGSRARAAGGIEGDASGTARLTAPMPGKAVRVLVASGDAVEARQPLVVVEAMKMENELTAPRAGTVTEVTVSEGESVEAGRLLVTIG